MADSMFNYTTTDNVGVKTGAFQANLTPNLQASKAIESLTNLFNTSIKAAGVVKTTNDTVDKQDAREKVALLDADYFEKMSKTQDLNLQQQYLDKYKEDVANLQNEYSSTVVKDAITDMTHKRLANQTYTIGTAITKQKIVDLGTDFGVALFAEKDGTKEKFSSIVTEFKGKYKALEGDNKERGNFLISVLANSLVNTKLKNEPNNPAVLQEIKDTIKYVNETNEGGKAKGKADYEKAIGMLDKYRDDKISLAVQAGDSKIFKDYNNLVEDKEQQKLNEDIFLKRNTSQTEINKKLANDLLSKNNTVSIKNTLENMRDKDGNLVPIDSGVITNIKKVMNADIRQAILDVDPKNQASNSEYLNKQAINNFDILKENVTFMHKNLTNEYLNIYENAELKKDPKQFQQALAVLDSKFNQLESLATKYPGLITQDAIKEKKIFDTLKKLPSPKGGENASLADRFRKVRSAITNGTYVSAGMGDKFIQDSFKDKIPKDQQNEALLMYNALLNVTGDPASSMEAVAGTYTFRALDGDSNKSISANALDYLGVIGEQEPYLFKAFQASFPKDSVQGQGLELMKDRKLKITYEQNSYVIRDDIGGVLYINGNDRLKDIKKNLLKITGENERPGIINNMTSAGMNKIGAGIDTVIEGAKKTNLVLPFQLANDIYQGVTGWTMEKYDEFSTYAKGRYKDVQNFTADLAEGK